jgi:hypothetical protein
VLNVYSLGTPFGWKACDELAKSCGGKHHKQPRDPFVGDPVAVWGQIRGAKEILSHSKDFYRLDHAYVGRLKYFRLTKGDFQPSRIVERPADRWESLKREYGLEIKPWNKGDGFVLVTLSAPATYEFFGVPKWPGEIVNEIKKYTDRPIRIRERGETRPLSEDLRKASCLVTYASNSVREALLAGVPVFTLGPSIARPMGLSEVSRIESPIYPENREAFFRHMAYCQFTEQEFGSGFALTTADENNKNGASELHGSPDLHRELAGS